MSDTPRVDAVYDPNWSASGNLLRMTEAARMLERELNEWHRIAGEKIAALERERDALKGAYETSHTSRLHAERCLEAVTQERDILLAEKRTFWKDDGDLRAEVERLRESVEVYRAKKQAMENENARLRTLLWDTSGGSREADAQVPILNVEVERLQASVETYRAKKQVMENENARLLGLLQECLEKKAGDDWVDFAKRVRAEVGWPI